MITRLKNFIFKKLEKAGKPQKVYILPTLDGLKLLGLNLILLIIGLSYANNYILLFNFILFGLFLCSMFYTHFNLEGLQIESVKLSPTHAGENNSIQIYFKSHSKLGHNSINLKIDSELIALGANSFSFTNKNGEQLKAELKIHALNRGIEHIDYIYLETLFPFHLFRCVSFHPCNLEIVVYPRLTSVKLFSEVFTPSTQNDENEEMELRQFQHGDTFSRVDWKKLAQTDKWYSKILRSPKLHPVTLSFQNDDLNRDNIEQQLSSIATYIRTYHSQGIDYGLSLEHRNKKTSTVIPNHSVFHLQHCLKLLAQYEH